MEPRRPPVSPLRRPPAISWQRVGDDAASQHQLQAQRQYIQQQLAEQRYQRSLRVARLGGAPPSHAARQDGMMASQSQMAARAKQHYELALSAETTRQVWEVQRRQRLIAESTIPTAYISQGLSPSDPEYIRRRQQADMQQAYAKYREDVEMISGEFTPLVLYDPVIKTTAQAGLLTMGSVTVGAAMPASMGWLNTSVTTFRAAPWQAAQAFVGRGALDGFGQYTANRLLGKGWVEAGGEVNWLETGMSGLNMNPYLIAVGSSGVAVTGNGGFQTIFHSEASGHSISGAKFITQAGVGLVVSHFGGKVASQLEENNYRAWRNFNISVLLRSPAAAEARLYQGLRWGQAFGPPLLFGTAGSTGQGYFGTEVENLWKNPGRYAEPPAPTHPDSPVFLDNPPRP